MTIHLLLDLEQHFRDKAAERFSRATVHPDSLAAEVILAVGVVFKQNADELAAVRRTLEARLEGLKRYVESDVVRHTSSEEYINADDLAACLVGAQEKK